MDYQNRPQRCLSSYSSSYQHSQVLPLCCSWKILPIPCSPICSFYGSPWVHQDLNPCGSAVTISGNPGPCLSGRLDHLSLFYRPESSFYPGNYQPVAISWMDSKLEKVYVEPLTHKKIERQTAHTIVSWPNPKQWMIVHTSDLMMIRQSIYITSIIKFCWIPSHCGIEGNEAADKLAKESLGLNIDALLGIYHADLKPQVNAYVQQLMQIKWDVEVHGRDLYLLQANLALPISWW